MPIDNISGPIPQRRATFALDKQIHRLAQQNVSDLTHAQRQKASGDLYKLRRQTKQSQDTVTQRWSINRDLSWRFAGPQRIKPLTPHGLSNY